jgi:hypothetical protein
VLQPYNQIARGALASPSAPHAKHHRLAISNTPVKSTMSAHTKILRTDDVSILSILSLLLLPWSLANHQLSSHKTQASWWLGLFLIGRTMLQTSTLNWKANLNCFTTHPTSLPSPGIRWRGQGRPTNAQFLGLPCLQSRMGLAP